MLEQGGLVQRLIDGRVHRCSLDAQALCNADAWLDHYRLFWNGTLDSLQAYLTATEQSAPSPRLHEASARKTA